MFATILLGFDFTPYKPYLPHLVGCGVATVVFAAVVGRKLFAGRQRDDAVDRPSTGGFENASFGDRRNALRREGQPVLVHLTSPAFHGATRDGLVLDRSTGGLRIRIDAAIAPGTAIQILAANAPDTTPWVTAIVRNCKPADRHFEVGCEFETTPPWNVLLLFG
jgi:PilZ domain